MCACVYVCACASLSLSLSLSPGIRVTLQQTVSVFICCVVCTHAGTSAPPLACAMMCGPPWTSALKINRADWVTFTNIQWHEWLSSVSFARVRLSVFLVRITNGTFYIENFLGMIWGFEEQFLFSVSVFGIVVPHEVVLTFLDILVNFKLLLLAVEDPEAR